VERKYKCRPTIDSKQFQDLSTFIAKRVHKNVSYNHTEEKTFTPMTVKVGTGWLKIKHVIAHQKIE
jgi:hypothetical protein